MPIQYPVAPGTILLCDYGRGFRVPEMVKRRPAVVISPRLPHRDHLCSVVPLSTTPPQHEVLYQCRIVLERDLPEPFAGSAFWVKADMVATVAFARLDLFRGPRDRTTGRRKYIQPKLSREDLLRVRCCALHALGLGALTEHLNESIL